MLESINKFETARRFYGERDENEGSVTKQKVKGKIEQKDTRFLYNSLPTEIFKFWCNYHAIQS